MGNCELETPENNELIDSLLKLADFCKIWSRKFLNQVRQIFCQLHNYRSFIFLIYFPITLLYLNKYFCKSQGGSLSPHLFLENSFISSQSSSF